MRKRSMVKKRNKITIHILCVSVLLVILAAEVYAVTKGGHLYGDYSDWYSQHTEFPSYFRQLYYKTGKLFPDFAMNLGMGQNIYYLAYYGLLSPAVLISYLLPGVPMMTYITVTAVITAALTIVLLYRWISHHLPVLPAFAASLFFTLAVPLTFHSHCQIMFVNYLPFLILAMEGLEKFVKDGRRLQLVISFFLIIMSSYFFSVGCTAVLGVYWIYLHLKDEGKIYAISFIKDGLRFAGTMLISVMMSAVLWLPVLKIIFDGRDDNARAFTLHDLLVPAFQSGSFFYGSSSLGLSALFFICVCWLLASGQRHSIFAGVVFLAMMFSALPVYILNGGMYVDGKVLIPFLPFAALMLGRFTEATIHRAYRLGLLLAVTAALAVPAFLTWKGTPETREVFIPDLILCVCAVTLLYTRRSRKTVMRTAINIVLICVMAVPLLSASYIVNTNGLLMSADNNSKAVYGRYARQLIKGEGRPVTEKAAEKGTEETYNDCPGFFRTDLLYDFYGTLDFVLDISQMRSTIYSSLSNASYRDYYYRAAGNEISYDTNAFILPSKNVMNLLTNGVRCLIIPRNLDVPPTYRAEAAAGSLVLCKSREAVPAGYASESGVFSPSVKKLSTDEIRNALSSISSTDKDGSLSFDLKDRTWITIPVKPADEDRIIRLVMHVDNTRYRSEKIEARKAGIIGIDIDSVRNVLSSPNWRYSNRNNDFNYTLYIKKGTDSLNLMTDPGRFSISDIELYSYDFNQYTEWRKHITAWDVKQKSDNMLSGKIRAEKDCTMIINIPYDRGFTVKVDGKETGYEKSPNAFISIPLKKGYHDVSLIFHAPGKKAGFVISAAGFCWLIILQIVDAVKKHKRNSYFPD